MQLKDCFIVVALILPAIGLVAWFRLLKQEMQEAEERKKID